MSGRNPMIGLFYQNLITILKILEDNQDWDKVIIEPKDFTKVEIKLKLRSTKTIHSCQVKT